MPVGTWLEAEYRGGGRDLPRWGLAEYDVRGGENERSDAYQLDGHVRRDREDTNSGPRRAGRERRAESYGPKKTSKRRGEEVDG
jgi:hypothetical protein